MRQDYTKQISVSFKADDSSIQKSLDRFNQGITKGLQTWVTSKTKGSLAEYTVDFLNKLEALSQKFLNRIETIARESWQEMNVMLKYSQLTDASIRNQAFNYGLSSSENYALSRTMNALGLQSEEDLYYMNSQQRAEFQKRFSTYIEKYTSLYDAGFFSQLQEFNYRMQDFQEQVQYEFIEFFMKNENEIMTAMRAITQLSSYAIKALSFFVTYFGGQSAMTESQRNATTRDIINRYSNTSITVDNTFNNVAQEDQGWLMNAGRLVFQPLIEALR